MKTGVYQIINVKNGKRYIGSASRSFRERRDRHWSDLRKGKHNPKLQNAWNKYGEESFKFEVLHEVEADDVLWYEQYYIDILQPEYNIARIAGASGTGHGVTGYKHSEEVKAKMKLIAAQRPPDYFKNRPVPNKGRKASIETKAKMSLAQSKRKHTEESKLKMRTSWLKRPKSLKAKQLKSLETIFNFIFNSEESK